MHGRDWPFISTVGIVFAYDGVELDTLCDTFEVLADQHPPEQCPDSVWVLNKGFIVWTSPENRNVDPGREPGAGYKAVEATPQQMLMPLTATPAPTLQHRMDAPTSGSWTTSRTLPWALSCGSASGRPTATGLLKLRR